MLAAFGDAALLHWALAFESALASAEAAEGLVLPAHAALIAAACAERYEAGELAEAAAHAGALAIPLVAALRSRVAASDPSAAESVHKGATSQDVADTVLMLQAKAGLALVVRDLELLTAALRSLAGAHAKTPMVGRTLLQPALPITFGLKAAQWLASVEAAAARLKREAETALALQFGGATGSRGGLHGKGAAVAARVAAELALYNPPIPWQARRDGVAGLGSALAILTGVLGKIARDVSLLAQSEVAEAFEPRIEGRGGSSAMAHKRNPTGCQVALSAAMRAPGLASALFTTLPGEHERGLGGWQAEAPVVEDLFLLAHGALFALAPVIQDLEVRPATMARNLDASGVGHDCAESEALVAAALAAYPAA